MTASTARLQHGPKEQARLALCVKLTGAASLLDQWTDASTVAKPQVKQLA